MLYGDCARLDKVVEEAWTYQIVVTEDFPVASNVIFSACHMDKVVLESSWNHGFFTVPQPPYILLRVISIPMPQIPKSAACFHRMDKPQVSQNGVKALQIKKEYFKNRAYNICTCLQSCDVCNTSRTPRQTSFVNLKYLKSAVKCRKCRWGKLLFRRKGRYYLGEGPLRLRKMKGPQVLSTMGTRPKSAALKFWMPFKRVAFCNRPSSAAHNTHGNVRSRLICLS